MSIVNVSADLTRCANALERIADILDKLLPPIYPQKDAPPPQDYPIEVASNESTYEQEINNQLDWWKDKVAMLMLEYGDNIAAYEEARQKEAGDSNSDNKPRPKGN